MCSVEIERNGPFPNKSESAVFFLGGLSLGISRLFCALTGTHKPRFGTAFRTNTGFSQEHFTPVFERIT